MDMNIFPPPPPHAPPPSPPRPPPPSPPAPPPARGGSGTVT